MVLDIDHGRRNWALGVKCRLFGIAARFQFGNNQRMAAPFEGSRMAQLTAERFDTVKRLIANGASAREASRATGTSLPLVFAIAGGRRKRPTVGSVAPWRCRCGLLINQPKCLACELRPERAVLA